jgi:hypothetical protein
MTTRGLPLPHRFALGFMKLGADKCWIWRKSVSSSGYGQIRVNGKTLQAHRVAYELATGASPGHLDVCHSCDNRRCVNPAHLWLGTHRDNNTDRHTKKRSRGGSLRGEANPMARLTTKQAIEIARAPGLQKEIARTHGIPFQCVSAIKSGKIWGHATGIKK